MDTTCAVTPCLVLCVHVFLCTCRLLCTHKWVECVCVCFLGVLQHICAGWVMGIPCLHSPFQHASDCCVGWMPSRLHIKNPLLIPYRAAQTSYDITFPFNCSQLTVVFFSPLQHTVASDIFHFGICCRDVLRGCACRWCINVHWSSSLNSSFSSAREPCRILVRYSWKIKCITSIPKAQIPDGTEWLEGDGAIFSSQQNSSSAK